MHEPEKPQRDPQKMLSTTAGYDVGEVARECGHINDDVELLRRYGRGWHLQEAMDAFAHAEVEHDDPAEGRMVERGTREMSDKPRLKPGDRVRARDDAELGEGTVLASGGSDYATVDWDGGRSNELHRTADLILVSAGEEASDE